MTPRCAESLEVWLSGDEERWSAYLDTDSEIVFYCPECAEREFGQPNADLVPHLVPTSAHLSASRRTEAGPNPASESATFKRRDLDSAP